MACARTETRARNVLSCVYCISKVRWNLGFDQAALKARQWRRRRQWQRQRWNLHTCHLETRVSVIPIFRCARAYISPRFIFLLLLHEHKPVLVYASPVRNSSNSRSRTSLDRVIPEMIPEMSRTYIFGVRDAPGIAGYRLVRRSFDRFA